MRPGARSHGTSYLQGGAAGFRPQAQKLLDLLAKDPFASLPRFEKLVGDLAGAYSRRINIQHRLVYQVLEKERTVKVLRMFRLNE